MTKAQSKHGTSTDLAPVKHVSEEAAANFEMDPHLINLLWSEPFFSNILRNVIHCTSPVTTIKALCCIRHGVVFATCILDQVAGNTLIHCCVLQTVSTYLFYWLLVLFQETGWTALQFFHSSQ